MIDMKRCLHGSVPSSACLLVALAMHAFACGGADTPPADVAADGGGGSPDAAADQAAPPLEAGADRDAATPPPGAFERVSSAPEACPLPAAACARWPDATTEGVVTKYTSVERFGAKTLPRTFHVFVPKAVVDGGVPAPLVIVLHGGNGSGTRFLATQSWTQLAQAPTAGLPWRPNGALCKALPTTEANGLVYQTAGGAACMPPVLTATSTKPFIVVYPDGLADPGTADVRHWEDGRLPSPGFDTAVPNRDDVGFIDHVVAVVLADQATKLDASSIYLAGASNGGIMTQRVAAEIANPAYPNLRRIAAFAAYISDLAKPLDPLASATIPFGMSLFHGTDVAMPNCNIAGCTTPTIAGDDRMPFGAAGDICYVNSPDRGQVLSGPDTIAAWRASLAGAAGAAAASSVADVGYFSKKTTTRYGTSPVELESWVTSGGGHGFLSSREDFLPVVRGWAFLSTFGRSANGTLTRRSATWVGGTY